MKSLVDLVQTLEDFFPGFEKTMQNSFDNSSHFDRLSGELNSKLPENYLRFYEKYNGQVENPEFAIQFRYRLLSLSESLKTREEWQLKFRKRDPKGNWWNQGWIPLMEDGEGGLIVVDLSGSFDGVVGQLIEVWDDWEDRTIEYSGLNAWIQTYIDSLNDDIWIEEDGSIIPKNDDDWFDFQETRNPGYPREELAGFGGMDD